jgi:hypothetical protein
MHFSMIECNFYVIDLSIFVICDVQYVVVAYVQDKLNIYICKSQMSNMYTKCINFYVFRFFFNEKKCNFVNLLFKFNIYVLSSKFK